MLKFIVNCIQTKWIQKLNTRKHFDPTQLRSMFLNKLKYRREKTNPYNVNITVTHINTNLKCTTQIYNKKKSKKICSMKSQNCESSSRARSRQLSTKQKHLHAKTITGIQQNQSVHLHTPSYTYTPI